MDNHALLTALVALIGISVLIQVLVLVGALIAIIKLRKAIETAVQTTTDLKSTIVPMVHNTRELIERISPQIVSITADIKEITQLVKKETAEVKTSTHDVIERVNHQTQRLDSMLTSGLNAVERAGSVIESVVSTPVRQANGIFAAVKAVVETYLRVDPRTANSQTPGPRATDVHTSYAHSNGGAIGPTGLSAPTIVSDDEKDFSI